MLMAAPPDEGQQSELSAVTEQENPVDEEAQRKKKEEAEMKLQ